MPADYDALERMGVSVKGESVIARYGGGWRGLKPKLAQDHGGWAIIYSDPATTVIPPMTLSCWRGAAGPGLPARVGGRTPDCPGDPTTGYGSTKDARRSAKSDHPEDPALIPTHLRRWRQAPASARRSDHHHVGGAKGKPPQGRSDWSLKPAYNVIATLKGRERPDEWIVRGNHRDGWVFGATDPLSGHVAMMGEAKALGVLLKAGWKPKRTIVYASWDGEEPGSGPPNGPRRMPRS
jgi:N-acetylated-alpha-linked acidic dipeptidase